MRYLSDSYQESSLKYTQDLRSLQYIDEDEMEICNELANSESNDAQVRRGLAAYRLISGEGMTPAKWAEVVMSLTWSADHVGLYELEDNIQEEAKEIPTAPELDKEMSKLEGLMARFASGISNLQETFVKMIVDIENKD